MNLKEFLRKQLLIFVVLVTCISLAMGITGSIFDSGRRFTYGAYFSPILYAGIYMLLQFITYSKKELTMKQYVFRCFLQFLVYETILISFALFISKVSIKIIIVLALCVPVVAVFSTLMIWFLDLRKAKEMKKELFTYQQKHSPH